MPNEVKTDERKLSPGDELVSAYNQEVRDRRKGKALQDNPYPRPPVCVSRKQYPHGEWVRGFLSESWRVE